MFGAGLAMLGNGAGDDIDRGTIARRPCREGGEGFGGVPVSCDPGVVRLAAEPLALVDEAADRDEALAVAEDHAQEDRQRAWLTGLMLRLGELIIGNAQPQALAIIEIQPCKPGERWERERAVTGFDECEVTAELARRWNFPSSIVRALSLASDPLAGKPLVPLAGVLHLAGRLADLPSADAEAIDSLPVPVMSALKLKYGWMKADFPDTATFVSLS